MFALRCTILSAVARDLYAWPDPGRLHALSKPPKNKPPHRTRQTHTRRRPRTILRTSPERTTLRSRASCHQQGEHCLTQEVSPCGSPALPSSTPRPRRSLIDRRGRRSVTTPPPRPRPNQIREVSQSGAHAPRSSIELPQSSTSRRTAPRSTKFPRLQLALPPMEEASRYGTHVRPSSNLSPRRSRCHRTVPRSTEGMDWTLPPSALCPTATASPYDTHAQLSSALLPRSSTLHRTVPRSIECRKTRRCCSGHEYLPGQQQRRGVVRAPHRHGTGRRKARRPVEQLRGGQVRGSMPPVIRTLPEGSSVAV